MYDAESGGINMDYSKEKILEIAAESVDAIYLTDVDDDVYTTLKDNEFFHTYFGDRGAFHVLMTSFLTGRLSKQSVDEKSYHAHFEKPIGFRNKLANQSRIHVEDKEYTISMTNYPVDDRVSAMFVNIISVGDYLQSEKNEDKASAVNSSYLFSMNVDLLSDSCSNMSMSEVEDNTVGGFDISYIDWRKSIIPMFSEESQKIFLEYTDPEFLKANLKCHQTKSADCQMSNLDGEIIWVKLIFNRINTGDDSEFRFVFMIEDINESHKRIVDELKTYESMAARDSLTGLLNHGSIEDNLIKYLKSEKNSNTDISLIMFDIDHFKKVNDTYGHAAGDNVLKTMSALAENCLSRYGCLLGRWGGEEFLGIIPGADTDQVYNIAEELRNIISQHDFDTVHSITSSFGVYQVKESDTAENAFNSVDSMLYKAKKNGRNCVIKD